MWSRPLHPGIIGESTGAARLCPLGCPYRGYPWTSSFVWAYFGGLFWGEPASDGVVMVVAALAGALTCITAPCEGLWGTAELGRPAGRRDNSATGLFINMTGLVLSMV